MQWSEMMTIMLTMMMPMLTMMITLTKKMFEVYTRIWCCCSPTDRLACS